MDSITCVQTYSHPTDIWSCTPSPRDPTLVFTSSGIGEAALWSASGADLDATMSLSATPLELVAKLPKPALQTLWQPGGQVAAIGRRSIAIYDLDGSSSTSETSSMAFPDSPAIASGAWDPHQQSSLCVAQGCGITGFDVRDGRHCKQSFQINSAHSHACRAVDFNPNAKSFLVSCGDDRLVKFWDLRKTETPVLVLAGHTHWCSTVKYNRFHDQLLLSGGTDAVVNLWRAGTVSSSPLLDMEGENAAASKLEVGDCKVCSFLDHEESVYSVAWSACDAWVFASVDYSGRVAINHVPSAEKYKILL